MVAAQRRVACAVAGAAIALALAGCAGGIAAGDVTPVVTASDATVSAAPSPTAADGPAWFTSRTPLEPCGQFGPPNNTEPPDVPDAAWQCLVDPDADGAELVLTRNSVEGQPIVTYLRAGPDIDGVEVIADNTADTYGSAGWTHYRCASFSRDYTEVGCVEW